MLTLERFKALADSYGAALRRWPEEVREDAEALLLISAEARLLLADARLLDEAITAASLKEDAEFWPPGEQSASLARLRAGVAARIASAPRRVPPGRSLHQAVSRWMPWPISMNFGMFGLATSGGLAVVAGLLIGSAYAPPAATTNMLTMLEPAPFQVAAE